MQSAQHHGGLPAALPPPSHPLVGYLKRIITGLLSLSGLAVAKKVDALGRNLLQLALVLTSSGDCSWPFRCRSHSSGLIIPSGSISSNGLRAALCIAPAFNGCV